MNNKTKHILLNYKESNIDSFRYILPPEKIAQFPLPERDKSKLLIYNNGNITESIFCNIHEFLPSGSLMVFNNSRVIKARLYFEKETGAKIEIFCLEPLSPSDFSMSMASRGSVEWHCIVGNLKKWKKGKIKCSFFKGDTLYYITAERVSRENEDIWRIRFTWDSELTFGEIIENAGHIPLPPYIERSDYPSDAERYQTIYSSIEGSVAAPTAGLHFTEELLNKIKLKEIDMLSVTLHVGAGTFKPVKSRNITEHNMHSEYFFADAGLIEKLLNKNGHVIAVGTTSLRVLESLYWAGNKLFADPGSKSSSIFIDQWEPYKNKKRLKPSESLNLLLEWMKKNDIGILCGSTKLMIVPGYSFTIPDVLITNFHLPGSTLLMLIAAWLGPNWRKVYDYALQNNFRFLSYGDSSLLFRKIR